MAEPALVLKNLTKTYGSERGVKNIDLTVNAGEIFGFLGPNGAGKSTTIRLILDIIKPNSGTITLLGQDSQTSSVDLRRKVGYLSGDMAMDAGLTGRQFLDYVANIRGGVDKAYLDGLIKRLGCELNKKIGYLSRGNKQKIGLAVALMHKPEVLILDEPTSGLDPLMQETFYELISDHAAAGKTAFISSHVLSEVQHICHRVGFIREGKLVAVEPLDRLMRNSFKTVQVWTTSHEALQLIKNTKNIKDASEQNGVIHCKVTGNQNPLLQTLSKLEVQNLLIEEANLEDLFMHYYKGEK